MASDVDNVCVSDPNYAAICSFIEQFGDTLGIGDISFSDVKQLLEESSGQDSRLVSIIIPLLRRSGHHCDTTRWQKSLVKFLHRHSQMDAWEVERFGFGHSNVACKIRVLKLLLERQFDSNTRFREKVNERSVPELRLQPVGRDKDGLSYWYLLDKESNLLVYREEQDSEDKEGFKLVCTNRHDLAHLIADLQETGEKIDVKNEDSQSSVSRISGLKEETGSLPPLKEEPDEDLSDSDKKTNKSDKVTDFHEALKTELQVKKDKEEQKVNNDDDPGVETDVLKETEKKEEEGVYKVKVKDKDKVKVKDKDKEESKAPELKKEVNEDKSKEDEKAEDETTVKEDATDESLTNAPVESVKTSSAEIKNGTDPKVTKPDIVKDGDNEKAAKSDTEKDPQDEDNAVKSDSERTKSSVKLEKLADRHDKKLKRGEKEQDEPQPAKARKTDNVANAHPSIVVTDTSNHDKVILAKQSEPDLETNQDPSEEGPESKTTDSEKNQPEGDETHNYAQKETCNLKEKKVDAIKKSDATDNIETEKGKLTNGDVSVNESSAKTENDEEEDLVKKNDENKSSGDDTDSEVEKDKEKAKRKKKTTKNKVDSAQVQDDEKSAVLNNKEKEESDSDDDDDDDEAETKKSAKKFVKSKKSVDNDENEDSEATPEKGRRKRDRVEIPIESLRRSTRAQKKRKIIDDEIENIPPMKASRRNKHQSSPTKSSGKKRRSIRAPVESSSDSDAPLSRVRSKRAREKSKESSAKCRKVVEEIGKKDKKSKRKKIWDSDEDFRSGTQGKKNGKRKKCSDSSSSSSEILEESESEELIFGQSTGDEFAGEESDSESNPIEKKGRNQQRQEALKEKEKCADDKPCELCEKDEHPEWILLCDKCDDGYHTSCLRPPLMIIPAGDWFCPPCEHKILVENLASRLKLLDQSMKKREHLVIRKERLAFVNVNLDNILKEGGREELVVHSKVRKKKKKKKHRSPSPYHRRSSRIQNRYVSDDETEESEEEEEIVFTRSTRRRKEINYQFDEYDQLIDAAIGEEVEAVKACPRPGPPPGRSRGKDMANIEGMPEVEDTSKPQGVMVGRGRGRKKSRRLTCLDDDNEPSGDNESEEYKASEDSISNVESDEDPLSDSSETSASGDNEVIRNSRRRRPMKKASRKSRGSRFAQYKADGFVVDSDADSNELSGPVRGTRRAARTRIDYCDDTDSSDEEAPKTKKKAKSNRKKSDSEFDATDQSSDTEAEDENSVDSDGSPKSNLKRRKYEDDSDFERQVSTNLKSQYQRKAKLYKKATKTKSKKKKESESENSSDEKSKARKKKNVIESDSEEEEEKEEDEKEEAKEKNDKKSDEDDKDDDEDGTGEDDQTDENEPADDKKEKDPDTNEKKSEKLTENGKSDKGKEEKEDSEKTTDEEDKDKSENEMKENREADANEEEEEEEEEQKEEEEEEEEESESEDMHVISRKAAPQKEVAESESTPAITPGPDPIIPDTTAVRNEKQREAPANRIIKKELQDRLSEEEEEEQQPRVETIVKSEPQTALKSCSGPKPEKILKSCSGPKPEKILTSCSGPKIVKPEPHHEPNGSVLPQMLSDHPNHNAGLPESLMNNHVNHGHVLPHPISGPGMHALGLHGHAPGGPPGLTGPIPLGLPNHSLPGSMAFNTRHGLTGPPFGSSPHQGPPGGPPGQIPYNETRHMPSDLPPPGVVSHQPHVKPVTSSSGNLPPNYPGTFSNVQNHHPMSVHGQIAHSAAPGAPYQYRQGLPPMLQSNHLSRHLPPQMMPRMAIPGVPPGLPGGPPGMPPGMPPPGMPLHLQHPSQYAGHLLEMQRMMPGLIGPMRGPHPMGMSRMGSPPLGVRSPHNHRGTPPVDKTRNGTPPEGRQDEDLSEVAGLISFVSHLGHEAT